MDGASRPSSPSSDNEVYYESFDWEARVRKELDVCKESLSKRNVQKKNLKGRIAEKEECVKGLEKDVQNTNYVKN